MAFILQTNTSLTFLMTIMVAHDIKNITSFYHLYTMQRQTNVTCNVPFLYLDDKKKMKLFPLLFKHKEIPDLVPYFLVYASSGKNSENS